MSGVGIGSGNHFFAVVGCATVLAALIIFERMDFGAAVSPSVHIRVTGQKDNLAAYQQILTSLADRFDFVAVRHKDDGSAMYAYDVVARTSDDLAMLVERLTSVAGTSDVRVHSWKRSGSISDKNDS